MPRLRINPPRRRESARVQNQGRSASAASTPTTARSTSSAGDTIEVAQKSDTLVEAAGDAAEATEATSPPELIETANAAVEVTEATSAEPMEVEAPATKAAEMSNAVVVRSPAREENADEDMVDVDDTVTEYDFSNEKEVEDDPDADSGIFVENDIITISSDDGAPEEREEQFPLDPRPWLGMTPDQRFQRELMYYTLRDPSVFNGDWEGTELFQEQLDNEMEEYIKDFPLHQWEVGFTTAEKAYDRLAERKRMRAIGVAVFRQGPPINPNGQPLRLLHNGVPSQHPGHAPQGHHNMPYYPPPQMMNPPMMHHGAMGHDVGPNPLAGPRAPPLTMQEMHHGMPQRSMVQHHAPTYQRMPAQHPLNGPLPPESALPSRPYKPRQPRQAAAANGAPTNGASNKGKAPATQIDLTETGSNKRKREGPSTAPVFSTGSTIVPPYPVREKPPGELKQTKQTTRAGRTSKRRVAEPTVFPWNRNLDFKAAKAEATWDVSFYEQETLRAMESVRATNAEYVQKIDDDDVVKQRLTRNARKNGGSEAAFEKDRSKRQVKQPKTQEAKDTEDGLNAPTYSFGNFCFATEEDARRGMALTQKLDASFTKTTPEELMGFAEDGQISMEHLGAIYVCWNPAKKGLTQDLEQIKFSIKDSLLTRTQLAEQDILTTKAAECIIDFCPDLLWRETLLRITSETDFRNKDVRDRMCRNGNYNDKATITKRIGSALGLKQGQITDKDEEYYKQNQVDYANYQLFFGHGLSQRKSKIGPSEKGKRKATEEASSSPTPAASRPGTSGSEGSMSGVHKAWLEAIGGAEASKSRATRKANGKEREIIQIDGADEEDEEEEDGGIEVEKEKKWDEVSVQSDGQLDDISD